jgi:alpha-glucosidase
MPVQRSLAIDYTHDAKIYEPEFENQYLFGPAILVAPVDSKQEFAKVYLPEGNWYELHTGKKHEGKNTVIVEAPVHKLPVFIKEGSIIPVQKSTRNATEKIDSIEYHIYAGGTSSPFTHYADDGESFEHEKGRVSIRAINYLPLENSITIGTKQGNYNDGIKKIKIVLHHSVQLKTAQINGSKVKWKNEQHSFFAPVEKFDPVITPPALFYDTVQTVTLTNTAEEIVVKW